MLSPRQLSRRGLAGVLALSALAGLLAAVANVGPSPGRLQIGTASLHVFVDMPAPSLDARDVLPQQYDGMVKRAEMLGRVMASNEVVDRIAARMHVAPEQIGALSRTTGPVPHALTEPDLEERAAQIQGSKQPLRLETQARPTAPIIDVYTQGRSADEAQRLALAAVASLRDQLRAVAAAQGFKPGDPVLLRELGPPRGAIINSKAAPVIGLLTFLVVAGLTFFVLMVLIAWRRRGLRLFAPRAPVAEPPPGDAWPHTGRLFPWTFAAFLVLLWLLPFNEITLNASLPIDLNLDRLLLPFVVLLWILALAGGGPSAPRPRLGGIQLAVTAFVTCAFLSVVIDARYLNGSLELNESFKRLPLLVSYVSLFYVAASGIRRDEVRAFLTFTLGLAVICAVGIIVEYRLKYNAFYGLSDKLLPSFFTVATTDAAAGVDNIGRRVVRGPAAVPLEAVAMLTMALPIALVWLMQARTAGKRVLYALATCLLLAAIMATFRKSALVVPLSVFGALAYFRRRELLRLAPLGFVLIVVIHVLSPGALGSTTSQLDTSKLGVATVSDRAVDYDAVRPDVWSHLMFGRGWGSYNHVNYRILDSEILQRVIETGVLGLIAFVMMGIAVLLCARKTIAARDPRRAPLALVGASAALSFVVASALFDILSFPHATYIFLYLAGLTAVVVAPEAEPIADAPRFDPHAARIRRPARAGGAARARSRSATRA